MELGPVAEHQRDRVALAQPERVQAAGERVDACSRSSPQVQAVDAVEGA